MARYAVVVDGRVVNTVEISPGNGYGGPGAAVQSDAAQVGDLYDGVAFAPGPRWPTIAAAKADLVRHVRAKRLAVEAAGVTVSGQAIATDTGARQRLREITDWSNDPPGQPVQVELANGSFVTLNHGQFVAFSRQVSAHVRGCASVLADKLAAIEALTTVTDAAAFADTQLGAGWPS